VSRIRRATELYDLVRLDHFRGFEAFWRIPGSEETAINGEWVKAPGGALFAALRESLGELPFIAEDLGLITPEVTALREQFGMPGMRVLQFGFGDKSSHMHLPHQTTRNTVFYTGTHDNDTTLGWWQNGASEQERRAVEAYLRPGDVGVVWAMIRAAAASVADLCIMPVQDILSLGSEARMNTPSQPEANWTWRMRPDALTPELAAKLAALMTVSDRDSHFASLG
jgi:4-alpha-glucanotransferase